MLTISSEEQHVNRNFFSYPAHRQTDKHTYNEVVGANGANEISELLGS